MGGAGRWRVGVSGVAGGWPQLVSDLLPRCSFPPPGSALRLCRVGRRGLAGPARAGGRGRLRGHGDPRGPWPAGGIGRRSRRGRPGGRAGRRALRGREGRGRRRTEPRGAGAGSPVRRAARRGGDRAHHGRPGRDDPAQPAPGLGRRRAGRHGARVAASPARRCGGTRPTPCVRPWGWSPVQDPSNDDPSFLRNRVRHELLPLCADVAGRDPVPLLARQAGVLRDEVALLNAAGPGGGPRSCRTPGRWPPCRSPWPGGRCANGSRRGRARATPARAVALPAVVGRGGAGPGGGRRAERWPRRLSGGRRVCRRGGRLSVEPTRSDSVTRGDPR